MNKDLFMKITTKQKEILTAIKDLSRANGISPTLNEIKEYLGYKSTSSVQRHTEALKRKKALNFDEYKPRSLRINDFKEKLVNIPLVGSVSCGKPMFANEDIEAFIPYQRNKLHGNIKDYFFLSAVGDSMNKANIDDGDFILIKRQNSADPGQKVVALLGDEATVKVLKNENGYFVLEPKSSNPIHKPIYIHDDTLIQGVVEGVLKNK